VDWKKLFQETILKPVAKAVSTASKTARKLAAPIAAAIPKPRPSPGATLPPPRIPQALSNIPTQVSRFIPRPVAELVLPPLSLFRTLPQVPKPIKKAGQILLANPKTIAPQTRKTISDLTLNIGMGFVGSAPSVGNKLVSQAAKRLRLSPEAIVEGIRAGSSPILKSLGRQLSKSVPVDFIKSYTPKGGFISKEGERGLNIAGGRYNLRALNTTDEVFDFIKSSARQNEELITMGRRGKVTFEQTRAAANKLGMTAEKLMKRKPGKAFNDAEIVAAGDILKRNSDDTLNFIKNYQAKVSKGLATDVDRVSILQKMNEQSLITSTVLGAKSEAGRALNANKIFNEASKSPLQKNLENVYKIFKDKDNADQLISRYGHLLATEGEEAAYKFVRSMHKPKGMDYLVEYWYNAILSSPSTHIINSLTNTVSTMLSPIEKTAAAAFDIPVSIIQRRPRARFFGETAADIIGGTAGISHGIRKGLYTLTHGYTVDDVGKLDIGRPEAFLKGKAGAIKPTRWLVAADKFFKGINFEATKYSLSYRQAAKEGLKGKALLARTADLINDTPADIIEAAGKAAKYRVFQEDPGTITQSILALRKSSGVGQFIIPFVQTPVNLVKFGTARSPLGLLINVPRAKGAAVSDELARTFIGSTVAAGAAMFALQGKITGAPPKDRAQRDAFYRTGKLPYAIKLGDRWISYQKLEPFNQAFTQIAAIHEAFKDGEAPATDKIMNVATQIGRNLISQTYLEGINNIFQAVEDPDRYAGDFIENFALGFVPGVSFLRSITRITDPTVRDPKGLEEALRASIPGLSTSVTPKRNVFGEDIVRPGGAIQQLFPIKSSKEQINAVDQELARLGLTVGYPTDIKIEKGGKEASDLFLKESGGYMKNWMSNFMNSSEYAEQNDEERAKSFEKIKDLSRSEFRGRIIASTYLFNESQLPTIEEKQRLWDRLKKEGIITDNVDEWIGYLRGNPSEQLNIPVPQRMGFNLPKYNIPGSSFIPTLFR